jgi:hypothetical protein
MDYTVTFHTSFVVTEAEWNAMRENVGFDPDEFTADAAEDEAADCFESMFGFFPNNDNWAATVEELNG